MILNLALYLKNNSTNKYQRTDLFNDESISITQVIQDVKDISKIFTEFTKTFSIPATAENNKLFKHYYNYDIDNGFDARVKIDGYIEINAVRFNKGKIKLEGVDLKDNKPYAYRITYFGDTINLKDILGEDKLNALDLSAYNKPYNSTDVLTYFQQDATTNDVIVPFISHTNRYYYDSSSGHANDERNLHYDTGGGHHHGLLWNQLKYAIRVDAIIQTISSQYGLSFSNDFFRNDNLDYYQLFLWLHRSKGQVQDAETGILPPELITNFDFGSTLNVGGEYDAYSAFMNLTTTSTTDYKFIIYKNGALYWQSNTLNGSQSGLAIPTILDGSFQFFIQSQSIITIDDITLQFGYLTDDGAGGTTITYANYFTTSSFNTNSTLIFDIAQQTPDIKIIDFLTGIFKMFNLTAYIDNGIIVVKTLNSFYATSNVYDITKYVVTDTTTIDVALPFKQIEFGYEDTKELLALKHNQQFNYEWGREIYNESSAIDGEIYKIELPFSHFKYERIYDIKNSTATDIQWGYSATDTFDSSTGNYDSELCKPLLFYPILTTTDFSFKKTDTSHQQITSYILPSNSRELNPATSVTNINFKQEFNEWTATNDFTGTLFELYYKDYIMHIFNPKNRLTKLRAFLPLSVLLNYKLNDRMKIRDRLFIINKITTNLTTGESQLELLNEL
jgi:hypothetical protein